MYQLEIKYIFDIRLKTVSVHCLSIDNVSIHVTKKEGTTKVTFKNKKTGNNLFYQQGNPQVSSALRSLTSVFGMGTGVSF